MVVAEARYSVAGLVDSKDIFSSKDLCPLVVYDTLWSALKVFGGKAQSFLREQHKVIKALLNGAVVAAGAAGGPVGGAVGKVLEGILGALLPGHDNNDGKAQNPAFTIDTKVKFGVVLEYVQEWQIPQTGKTIMTHVHLDKSLALGPGEMRMASFKESAHTTQSSSSTTAADSQTSKGQTSGSQALTNTVQGVQKLLGQQLGTMKSSSTTDSSSGSASFSTLFFNANFLKSKSTVTGTIEENGMMSSDATLLSSTQEAINNATQSALEAARTTFLSAQAQELSVFQESSTCAVQGNPSQSHAMTLWFWQVQQEYKVRLILKAMKPAVLMRVIPANEQADLHKLHEGDPVQVLALEQCLKSHKLLLHVSGTSSRGPAPTASISKWLEENTTDDQETKATRKLLELLQEQESKDDTAAERDEKASDEKASTGGPAGMDAAFTLKAFPLWSLVDERPVGRVGLDEFYFNLALPADTQQGDKFKEWVNTQLRPQQPGSAAANLPGAPRSAGGGMVLSERTVRLPVGQLVELRPDRTELPGAKQEGPFKIGNCAAAGTAAGGSGTAAAATFGQSPLFTSLLGPAGFAGGGVSLNQQPALAQAGVPQLGMGQALAAGMQASSSAAAAGVTAAAAVDQAHSSKWGQIGGAAAQALAAVAAGAASAPAQ